MRLARATQPELEEVLGPIKVRAHFVRAARQQKLAWVHPVRQSCHAHVHVLAQQDLNAAHGRVLAGLVRVEHEHCGIAKAPQRPRVMLCQRCAQDGHHVIQTELVGHDHVRVTLHDDGRTRAADALPGLRDAVEAASLVE